MQTLILSDVRRVAYRLFAWGRKSSLLKAATGCRLPVSAAAVLGIAVAMLLMPACKSKNTGAGAVWAEVDGHPIYRAQVEKIFHSRVASTGEAVDPEEALSYKLNILNELINNQILMARASKSGITVSESEIDTKMGQLKSPYTEQQFEEKLKSRDITEDDLRDEVRTTLTMNKLINRDINSRVTVSDADVKAYYEKNKSSFDVPETEYHLAQIQVTPGSSTQVHNLKNDDAKTPQMAQRKIQALYAQLRSGQDFATVAQNYSEDPATSLSGGDMGFITESQLAGISDLERVVKGLKVGEISKIIPTQSGYHIIKLLGIRKAGQHSLSEPKVQSQIRKTLQNEKEQLLKAAYIENLRDNARVKNLLAEQIVKSFE